MDSALVIQALGITITAILGIASYSSRSSIKRLKEELKLDLEILEKLEQRSENHNLLTKKIGELFELIYKSDQKQKFHIYNWDDLLIGGGLTAFSMYFTLYALERESLWSLLAAFFVIVGLGMIPDAFKPSEDDEKSSLTNNSIKGAP